MIEFTKDILIKAYNIYKLEVDKMSEEQRAEFFMLDEPGEMSWENNIKNLILKLKDIDIKTIYKAAVETNIITKKDNFIEKRDCRKCCKQCIDGRCFIKFMGFYTRDIVRELDKLRDKSFLWRKPQG